MSDEGDSTKAMIFVPSPKRQLSRGNRAGEKTCIFAVVLSASWFCMTAPGSQLFFENRPDMRPCRIKQGFARAWQSVSDMIQVSGEKSEQQWYLRRSGQTTSYNFGVAESASHKRSSNSGR